MATQEYLVDTKSCVHQQATNTLRVQWAKLPDKPTRHQIEKRDSQLTLVRQPQRQLRRQTVLTPSPVNALAECFFRSQRFAYICIRASQLANYLPTAPPPLNFVCFQETRMNTWYLSILLEFSSRFEKRVRSLEAYPLRQSFNLSERAEDHNSFNRELVAHINSVLHCFNDRFEERPLGSTDGLTVDEGQENVAVARAALIGATAKAVLPPKAQWKSGEKLHVEYSRRLRCFRAAVENYIEYGSPNDRWILREQEQLKIGLAFHEEYYVRQMRDEWLAAHRSST